AAISNWFADALHDDAPDYRAFAGKLIEALRYGENPHQSAAFYRSPGARFGVASARQLQGKQLSYNNINDTDAAYECVAEFDPGRAAGCGIVTHSTPCGVAEGDSLTDAYKKALACDATSAFGGIVALHSKLDAEAATAMPALLTARRGRKSHHRDLPRGDRRARRQRRGDPHRGREKEPAAALGRGPARPART